MTGNNPNPSTFQGSSSGTEISIGTRSYSVEENLSIDEVIQKLAMTLNEQVGIIVSASGDCTSDNISDINMGTISGTEIENCEITNTVQITDGTVPNTGSQT